jgi:SAM-dependent methyltransferase
MNIRYTLNRIIDRTYRTFFIDKNFNHARNDLLSSATITDQEKAMLHTVSLKVDRNDTMYELTRAGHYLSVGLSAIQCIENAIKTTGRPHEIKHILDFPCGYGRVLRFLRAGYPDAEITVCEIDPAALDFCKKTLCAKPVMSEKDFSKLSLPDKFDLIWCGSLITHIDEETTKGLLKFFHAHLSPGGICVLTTHGQKSAESVQNKIQTYGLPAVAQQELLATYQVKGYGYANYEGQSEYGISIVNHNRMLEITHSIGQWNETYYQEQGWDNHQDVYGFYKV